MVMWLTTSKDESSALERGAVGQQSDAISAMRAVQAVAPVPLTTQDARFLVPLAEQMTLLPHQDFSHDIPVIDLSGSRDDIVAALTDAATSWGVFQVVNHGMPTSTMNEMLEVAKNFFSLPEEEKLASAPADHTKDVPHGYMPMAESFHKLAGWSNALEYVLRPEHLSPSKEAFPSAAFRATVENFGEGLHQVLVDLVELLLTAHLGPKSGPSKSTNLLDANRVQVIRIASYEPCPQPDAVMGVRSHVDHTLITGLVQDNTGGLQVEKDDGQWHGVAPLPGAIVILTGTAIQMITNDKIKAVNHRAVVNGHSSRISITSAVNPSNDTILFPASELVDEMHPPLYRPFKYGEFRVQAFEEGILKSRDVVEKFRIRPVDAKPAHPVVGVKPHAPKLERDVYLPDLLRFESAGIVVA